MRILIYFNIYFGNQTIIIGGVYDTNYYISVQFNYFAVILEIILNSIIGVYVANKLYKMELKNSVYFVVFNLIVQFCAFLLLFIGLIFIGINVIDKYEYILNQIEYESIGVNQAIIGFIKGEILLATVIWYVSISIPVISFVVIVKTIVRRTKNRQISINFK